MKIAIIGASTGQLPLCLKAKEMGLTTICFAWETGAVCKEYVDKFYPISIFEKEEILNICIAEEIDGVVSNASEVLMDTVAYISEQMKLDGNKSLVIEQLRNKLYVREATQNINTLKNISVVQYDMKSTTAPFLPCVVKPITGDSKKGVFFINNNNEFDSAIGIVKEFTSNIMIEEYIPGQEYSVETLSFRGEHSVIQITEKESSGAPHFVELSHHQPAPISCKQKKKITDTVKAILSELSFESGAAHIEIKVDQDDNIYLIECNPRGGGDEISNTLVSLSTNFDYLKGMIDVALGIFRPKEVKNISYSGIYFLCEQTKARTEFFKNAVNEPWLVDINVSNYNLSVATGNYDRNGYLIYNSDKKIINS